MSKLRIIFFREEHIENFFSIWNSSYVDFFSFDVLKKSNKNYDKSLKCFEIRIKSTDFLEWVRMKYSRSNFLISHIFYYCFSLNTIKHFTACTETRNGKIWIRSKAVALTLKLLSIAFKNARCGFFLVFFNTLIEILFFINWFKQIMMLGTIWRKAFDLNGVEKSETKLYLRKLDNLTTYSPTLSRDFCI